jgi:hypothetical protein
MTARRSSGLIPDQRPISSIERWQPMQMRAWGCTTQILTQGLSISARLQTSSLMPARLPDA